MMIFSEYDGVEVCRPADDNSRAATPDNVGLNVVAVERVTCVLEPGCIFPAHGLDLSSIRIDEGYCSEFKTEFIAQDIEDGRRYRFDIRLGVDRLLQRAEGSIRADRPNMGEELLERAADGHEMFRIAGGDSEGGDGEWRAVPVRMSTE